eukprot:GGOE01019265.1.p1 GENE.GGOE01019265.1~~GGOE01019265.1.p1  ORF type:complete len:446 (+),score=11.96 GGOE01019265.1:146-1339(+)
MAEVGPVVRLAGAAQLRAVGVGVGAVGIRAPRDPSPERSVACQPSAGYRQLRVAGLTWRAGARQAASAVVDAGLPLAASTRSCSLPLCLPLRLPSPVASSSGGGSRAAPEGRSSRSRTVSPKPACGLPSGAFPPARRHRKPLPHFSQVADVLPPACYPRNALKADDDALDLPPALPTAPLLVQLEDRLECAANAPRSPPWPPSHTQGEVYTPTRRLPDKEEWPAPRRAETSEWPEPRRAAILLPRSVSPPSALPPAFGLFQQTPLPRCPSAERATLHDHILSVRSETSSEMPEAVWEHILGAVDSISDDDIVYNWHHVVAGQAAMMEVGKRVEEVRITVDGAVCSICLDPILRNLRGLQLPCGHLFHGGCVMTWLRSRTRCPNCNYDLLRNSWGGGS